MARTPQRRAGRPRKSPEPRSFYAPEGEGPAVRPEGEGAESVRVGDGLSADAAVAQASLGDEAQRQADIARIRQMRRPLGSYTQKLALPERRGYHRHWFNDQPGRVDEALSNGWAHIMGRDGKPIKRVVGTGRDRGALHAYAMEIPEEFWLEDMRARHDDAQARVDAIKASPFRAKTGEAKASDQGKFYSPTEEAGPLQVVKA